MVKAIIAIVVGAVLGIMLAVFVGGWFSEDGRAVLFHGVGLGFGAGFGAVAAAIVLNKLVGYLDRVASGKA